MGVAFVSGALGPLASFAEPPSWLPRGAFVHRPTRRRAT